MKAFSKQTKYLFVCISTNTKLLVTLSKVCKCILAMQFSIIIKMFITLKVLWFCKYSVFARMVLLFEQLLLQLITEKYPRTCKYLA